MATNEELPDSRREEILRLLNAADSSAGVLVMPTESENHAGVYSEGMDELAKDLSRDGIVVAWADEPARRLTSGKKSATEMISAILAFPFGVAGNAAWYAIANRFGLRGSGHADVDFVRQTSSDGTTFERLTYRGPASDLAEIMRAALPPDGDAAPPE